MNRAIANPDGDQKFDYSIQVQLPNEWDASLAKKNIGVTAGVETSFANPIWTNVHCSKMDLVIVPSNHTRDSLLKNSVTTTPIKVVPETYFDELELDHEPMDLGLSTSFNFLAIGVMTGASPDTDRKNLFYMLKWFLEEFKDDPDVGLILKTNRGRETSIDRKVTLKLIRQIMKEVQRTDFPKIHLLHGVMSRKDMASLYNSNDVKALISCTRGEGFGLPLIEAAVSGMPVLATNWSAHKEFLDLGKWIKFEYDLRPISKERVDGQIFMPGSQWAEVREQDFKQKIRKFYKSNQLPQKWAQELSLKIKEKYGWKQIVSAYDQALSEIFV